MEYITIIIIAITSIISVYSFSNESIYEKLLFSIRHIYRDKDYYRVISSAFIHGDWEHLIFNMFTFYNFSNSLESSFNASLVVVIFLGSIIGGSLFSIIHNRRDIEYRAVGASGGVCGIIYASIFLMENGSIYIFPLPIAIPDYIFAIGYLLITTFALNRDYNDNIGHDAHLGGALTGTAIALIHSPWLIMTEYYLIIGMIVPLIAIPILNRLREGR